MSEKDLKQNVKLYPSYRAFSYDFLFLWTISILYLTEVKGLSYSQVILLDSIFMFVTFGLQVPITKLVAKIGKIPSARFASICWLCFSLIYLFGEGFTIFIFANFLYGLGNSIKNITDLSILSITLDKLNRKRDFGVIEGKAMFRYNIIEAITSILAGYFYEFVSPYAPIIGTVVCCAVAVVLSFTVKDPIDDAQEELEVNAEEERKSKRAPSYKALLKRPFVISMIIFCFSLNGLLSVFSSLSKMYYQNINTPAYLFGYIFGAFKLISALTYKYEFKYELKKGVKCLIIFSTLALVGYLANALVYSINPSAIPSIIIITTMIVGQQIARSAYRISVKNYINACSTKSALSKTLTLYSMAEALGYACITMFTSLVLQLSGDSYVITNLSLVALLGVPIIIGVTLFVRALIKSYMARCTIIRKDIE